MKVLELFAGSRSVGKVADQLGWEVFSSDFEAFEGIDYQIDILKFDVSKVPFKPDIIWASPPCTGFSVAMGDLNLIHENLRDGGLVAPFERTVGQGLSYYLAYPPDRAQQPKIRVLREWLSQRSIPARPD